MRDSAFPCLPDSTRLTPSDFWQSAGTYHSNESILALTRLRLAYLELAFRMNREPAEFARLALLAQSPYRRLSSRTHSDRVYTLSKRTGVLYNTHTVWG